MQIERIELSRRDKSKLILHFTDGSCAETLADDTYMLKAGAELSSEQVAQLSRSYRQSCAKKSAVRSLSHRSMSEHELIAKLRERGYTAEESEGAARWLEEMGIIDDESYAASCAAYYKSRGYGELRIREELRRRGIAREMSDEVIAALPASEAALDALIEKKLRGGTLDAEKKRKLTAFLLRRGFEYEEIRAAFSRLFLDAEDMI